MTENDVFAADAGNRVMLRYDKSGKLVRRIGEKNKERNIPGFIIPSPFFDVEIAPRRFAARQQSGTASRGSSTRRTATSKASWGTASMGIEGFCGCCNPINLALLPDGRFVTCEKGLPRVKIYSADGRV